jgi:hypothetical protein
MLRGLLTKGSSRVRRSFASLGEPHVQGVGAHPGRQPPARALRSASRCECRRTAHRWPPGGPCSALRSHPVLRRSFNLLTSSANSVCCAAEPGSAPRHLACSGGQSPCPWCRTCLATPPSLVTDTRSCRGACSAPVAAPLLAAGQCSVSCMAAAAIQCIQCQAFRQAYISCTFFAHASA